MARVAIVTGGSRGIGAAISRALKAAGYSVAANYAGNDEAAAKFKQETGIPVYKWDVSDYASCAAGIAQVEADLGPVDVLVNNAGITRDGFFHKMAPEQWSAVISSINGQKGQAGQANYSAAKAGELGFIKALAQENANKGITVNAICPGYIGTEMVRAIPQDVLDKRILPLIPVGRLGEPEEIARCVAFLAADESGFITGSTLSANGGQYMA